MTIAETLKAVQAAVAGDVPLTGDEEKELRAWTENTSADLAVVIPRGSLRELAKDVARQSGARQQRQEQAAVEARGRERMQRLAEREALWLALPDLTAAVFCGLVDDPNNLTFKLLLKHLQQTDRGRAPRTFDPDNILLEHERLFG